MGHQNAPYATIEYMNTSQADSTNPQESAPSLSGDAIDTRTANANPSAVASIAAENHATPDIDGEYEVVELMPLPTVPIRQLPTTPLVRPAMRNWGDLAAPLPATSTDDSSASSLTEELIADRASERY